MPGQMSLFAGRKQRGRAEPPLPERHLQNQTAEVLKRWCHRDWRYSHFPAGGHRDKVTAAHMKRAGLVRGWPDFLLLRPVPPLLHMLELKRRGESLTDEQEAMQTYCRQYGYPYAVADNYDAVLAILRAWGAVRVSISA